MNGLVSVAAEDAASVVLARVVQSSRGYLGRHAEPARVQPVNEPYHGLALEVEFLQLKIERRSHFAQPHIIYLESVELVAVDADVTPSVVLPNVVLIDADSDQVRHDVGESVVVIAFDPHDLDVAFGIRELANVAEKLPVVFGEAVRTDVARR